jgi:hypothetical protein
MESRTGVEKALRISRTETYRRSSDLFWSKEGAFELLMKDLAALMRELDGSSMLPKGMCVIFSRLTYLLLAGLVGRSLVVSSV